MTDCKFSIGPETNLFHLSAKVYQGFLAGALAAGVLAVGALVVGAVAEMPVILLAAVSNALLRVSTAPRVPSTMALT